ncbi:hypothetical protein C3L33_17648, partial [Rhododendron williamsianum]
MGLSPSKRVSETLTNSPDFTSTCTSVYQDCLTLAQHAFPGVQPYQLSHATSLLHHSLSSTHPLLKTGSPPLRPGPVSTAPTEPEFAVEVFTGAVVDNATAAVVKRVPIGVVGIVGVGLGVRAGKDLVGALVGVYSVGVAASVYLSLLAG